MRKIVEWLLRSFLRLILWFRYRVKVKGLEKLTPEVLNRPGGILFLPNHPTVFVDPLLVAVVTWPHFNARPVVVEYMYYTPIVNWVVRVVRAVPIPNLSTTTNSLKLRKSEQALETVSTALRNGDNFVIYPAGRIKQTNKEVVGASSGVHKILQDVPEANIVLVRTTGLWGSSFSRALTGKTPSMFQVVTQGIKIVLKNLLFFTPRREVTIDLEVAGPDLPRGEDRMAFNKYLEDWYNRPDGQGPETSGHPGETLTLVPYSIWSKELPKIKEISSSADKNLDIAGIPDKIKKKVIAEVASISERDPNAITPEMHLSTDLGLDSLDTAEILSFLSDQFGVVGVQTSDLSTVGSIMVIASGQVRVGTEVVEEDHNLTKWHKPLPHERVSVPEGKTIPEVFLRNCDRYPDVIACGDVRSGVMTYRQLKMRVLLLAEYIRKLPGKTVGVLLPASVGANIVLLACQIAGKVPVMVNWTVGPRHLEAVVAQSGIKGVISSWGFVDRLENIDFGVLNDMMLMLEEISPHLSVKDKLRAWVRSRRSADALIPLLGVDRLFPESRAVILFTSGTESQPKGVPLSHRNILSNQRAALETVKLYRDDVVYGILPPFHSFGFTVTGLLPLLVGVKVAYSPDPTDSIRLARGVKKWGITILVSAPTFLKGILSSAEPKQVQSLRMVVSGAEKAPQDLFDMVAELREGMNLTEGYGITECSPIVTINRHERPGQGVGRPLPNIELAVVHPESHEVVPKGQQGLVLVHGPNVFSGYLGEGVVSPFIWFKGQQWYQTGDLGYLDEEANLVLVGRAKRFVKIGGEMVSLTSIEDALQQKAKSKGWSLPEDAPGLAVCVKEVPGDKPKLVVFVTFDASADEMNKALKQAGFSNLIKISGVQKEEIIPLMAIGKVHYRLLEEKLKSEV